MGSSWAWAISGSVWWCFLGHLASCSHSLVIHTYIIPLMLTTLIIIWTTLMVLWHSVAGQFFFFQLNPCWWLVKLPVHLPVRLLHLTNHIFLYFEWFYSYCSCSLCKLSLTVRNLELRVFLCVFIFYFSFSQRPILLMT